MASRKGYVLVDENGALVFNETTTPTSETDKGKIYTKSDNNLYFQDGSGVEKQVVSGAGQAGLTFQVASFNNGSNIGIFYAFGFYLAPAAAKAFSQAAATQVYGSSNHPYGASAFLVAGGVGTASGGTGAVRIKVTGTSITDAGVRTAADTEVIISDITTTSLNAYYETTKKWLGTITFTIENAPGSTQTTFALSCNYGLAKYNDNGNRNFTITDFEMTGLAGSADTGFNIQLLHHKTTGWTYNASSFTPGTNTSICNMNTDYGTEKNLANNIRFAYKRTGLSTVINGNDSEGFIVRVTCGANNSVARSNIGVGSILN